MTAATAHALGFLLSRSVDQPALLTAEQAVQLNEAARNLCHYAIGEIAPNRWLLSAALTAICRTYEANPAVCRESISHCFGADHLRTHGYVELPILSHEAKWLLRADPALLKLLYEVAFEFEETSEQSTAMGGPVFALSFSRRQEVEQVRWELGQFFKTFLEVCPGLATQTLMAVLERDDARTRPASHRQRREYSFSFEGSTVWFVEDGSGFREQFGAQDVAGEMLLLWVAHTEEAAANRIQELDEILRSVREVISPAVAWRKLMQAGTRNPAVISDRLRPVCSQPALLLAEDTAQAAREFVATVYPRLTSAEKTTTDRVIIKIPSVKGYGSKERLSYLREQIVVRLRKEDIVTPELVRLYDAAVGRQRTSDGHPSSCGPSGLGILPSLENQPPDPVPQELCDLVRPVADFSFRHLNDVPDRAIAQEILPHLHALAEMLRRESQRAAEGAWIQARRQLAKVCAILARTKSVEIAASVRTLVLPLLDDCDPSWSQEAEDGLAERGYSMVPGVRGHIAVALSRIAPQLDDVKIRRALTRLASDQVGGVRREVVAHLAPITASAPEWAWRLIDQRSRKETNSGVLLALVYFTLVPLANRLHSARVSLLAKAIFDRARGKGAEELRRRCTGLFLHLCFNMQDRRARAVLDCISEQPVYYTFEIVGAASELRGWLVSDGTPKLDRIAEMAWSFLTLCVSAARVSERKLDAEWNASPSPRPRESIQKDYAALGKVVDAVGNALYFASGAFEGVGMSQGKRKTVLTAEQRDRFLSNAGPVLDALAEFGLPTVAHRLAEICETYLDIDPRGTLLRLALIVRAGHNYRYESDPLAVALIVRLIERYLAEYRHLVREHGELQGALREILEAFVGWPSALQLIYRLDELYR